MKRKCRRIWIQMKLNDMKSNNLRWYSQQRQHFIFTHVSDACCEAKRWKHLRPSRTLLNPTWLRQSGTVSETSLNLTRHLHQCTPELFWAEDPMSVRCWGKRHETPWNEIILTKSETIWNKWTWDEMNMRVKTTRNDMKWDENEWTEMQRRENDRKRNDDEMKKIQNNKGHEWTNKWLNECM